MVNTFTQIYIHFVFSVMNRECLIKRDWETEEATLFAQNPIGKGQKSDFQGLQHQTFNVGYVKIYFSISSTS